MNTEHDEDRTLAGCEFPPAEVAELCAKLWGRKKWRNLDDPALGGTPWGAMIAVYEELVEDAIRRMVTRPRWSKRELIAFRRVIDASLRYASEPPAFYGVPLYVSQGVLVGTEREGEPKQVLGTLEHVLPLAVLASGTLVINDPCKHLPAVRRAIVGPTCWITTAENRRLPRKSHLDPERPFLRYASEGIVAYRVLDGLRIDGARYGWEEHLDYMLAKPSYAGGARMLAEGEAHWRRVLAETGFRGFGVSDLDDEAGEG